MLDHLAQRPVVRWLDLERLAQVHERAGVVAGSPKQAAELEPSADVVRLKIRDRGERADRAVNPAERRQTEPSSELNVRLARGVLPIRLADLVERSQSLGEPPLVRVRQRLLNELLDLWIEVHAEFL